MMRTQLSRGCQPFWSLRRKTTTIGSPQPASCIVWKDSLRTRVLDRSGLLNGLLACATNEGVARFSYPNRPFTITRSTYTGSQRYSSGWAGDNIVGD
jgi:hypothetical protein